MSLGDRAVVVSDEALHDIIEQLGPDHAGDFVAQDLTPLLRLLSATEAWDRMQEGPWPGRRLAVSTAATVGAFSLFAVLDTTGHTITVYALDLWPGGWPD